MIIYLSGPMTGLPGNNYDEFNKWEQVLTSFGHHVLNPARNDGGSTDKTRAFYMRLDTAHLLEAQIVVLLPGWELSTGVRYELAIANELGLAVYRIEELVLNSYTATQLQYDAVIQINKIGTNETKDS